MFNPRGAHLSLEELLDVLPVRVGVRGDVDGAGGDLLHPQLDGPADLCQVREAHGHGEGEGRLPAVADALRGRHEVRAGVAALQQPAGILLSGMRKIKVL